MAEDSLFGGALVLVWGRIVLQFVEIGLGVSFPVTHAESLVPGVKGVHSGLIQSGKEVKGLEEVGGGRGWGPEESRNPGK